MPIGIDCIIMLVKDEVSFIKLFSPFVNFFFLYSSGNFEDFNSHGDGTLSVGTVLCIWDSNDLGSSPMALSAVLS